MTTLRECASAPNLLLALSSKLLPATCSLLSVTTLRELASARLLLAPCSKLLPDHVLVPLRQTPPGPLMDRSLAHSERGFSSPESLVMQNRRNSFHMFFSKFFYHQFIWSLYSKRKIWPGQICNKNHMIFAQPLKTHSKTERKLGLTSFEQAIVSAKLHPKSRNQAEQLILSAKWV